ncbi:hypothetical protein, conserved [Entamoeba dispar SAW760]|uniref:Uncharacterized protein n=1 Tax=Entamoeba dispar (strain ATCC PRA-260 / SAW760) TaxID=370354 RepID=B0ER98_ENTDS|nr:uncharacterized protein EDI_351360 [Entamoeba dispar SAW760]EDR22946.1 hypothetical protein, conserved [Entamoeba dispar SAW760]|eukprot:EDR22946.1 hypothetical protein, conserved [Entamoeba dispar SAW760]
MDTNSSNHIKDIILLILQTYIDLIKEINETKPDNKTIKELQKSLNENNTEFSKWFEGITHLIEKEYPYFSTKMNFENFFFKTKVYQILLSKEFRDLSNLKENELINYQIYIHRAIVTHTTMYYTLNYIFCRSMLSILFNIIKAFLSKAFYGIGNPIEELNKMQEKYKSSIFILFQNKLINEWFIKTQEELNKFNYHPIILIKTLNTTKSSPIIEFLITTYRQIVSFFDLILFLFGQHQHFTSEFKFNTPLTPIIEMLKTSYQQTENESFKAFVEFIIRIVNDHCVPLNRKPNGFAKDFLGLCEQIHFFLPFHFINIEDNFVDTKFQQSQLKWYFSIFTKILEKLKENIINGNKLKISTLICELEEGVIIINNLSQDEMDVLLWAQNRIKNHFNTIEKCIDNNNFSMITITLKRLIQINSVIKQYCMLLLPKDFDNYEIEKLEKDLLDGLKRLLEKIITKEQFINLTDKFQNQIQKLISTAIWKGRDEEIVNCVITIHLIYQKFDSFTKLQKQQAISTLKETIKRFINCCRERKPIDRTLNNLLDKLEIFSIEYESMEKFQNILQQILYICETILTEIIDCFEYISEISIEYSHNLLDIMCNMFQKHIFYKGFSLTTFLKECIGYTISILTNSIPITSITEELPQYCSYIILEATCIDTTNINHQKPNSMNECLNAACKLENDLFKLTSTILTSYKYSFKYFSLQQRINFIILTLCNTVSSFCVNFFSQNIQTQETHFNLLKEESNKISIIVEYLLSDSNSNVHPSILSISQMFDKFSDMVLPLIQLLKQTNGKLDNNLKETYTQELLRWNRLIVTVCLNNCSIERLVEDFAILSNELKNYISGIDLTKHYYAISGMFSFFREYICLVDKFSLNLLYPSISCKANIMLSLYSYSKQFERTFQTIDLSTIDENTFFYLKQSYNKLLIYLIYLVKPYVNWSRVYLEINELIDGYEIKNSSVQIKIKSFFIRSLSLVNCFLQTRETVDCFEIAFKGYCNDVLLTYNNLHIPIEILQTLKEMFIKRIIEKDYIEDIIIDIVYSFKLFNTIRYNLDSSSTRIEFQLINYHIKKTIDNALNIIRLISPITFLKNKNIIKILHLIGTLNEDYSSITLIQDIKIIQQRITIILSSFTSSIQKLINFESYYSNKMLFFYKQIIIFYYFVNYQTNDKNQILLNQQSCEKIMFEARKIFSQILKINNIFFYFTDDTICLSKKGNTLLSKYITNLLESCNDLLIKFQTFSYDNLNTSSNKIIIQQTKIILERINDILSYKSNSLNKKIIDICENVVDGFVFFDQIKNINNSLLPSLNLYENYFSKISDIVKAAILAEIETRRELNEYPQLTNLMQWKFDLYHSSIINFILPFRQMCYEVIEKKDLISSNNVIQQIKKIIHDTGIEDRVFCNKTIREFLLQKDLIDQNRLKRIKHLRILYDMTLNQFTKENCQIFFNKIKEFNLEDEIPYIEMNEIKFNEELMNGMKQHLLNKIQLFIPSVKVFSEECIKFYKSCNVLLQTICMFKNSNNQIEKIRETLKKYWNKLKLLLISIQLFDYMSPSIGIILSQQYKITEKHIIKMINFGNKTKDIDYCLDEQLPLIYNDLVIIAGISFLQNNQTTEIIKLLNKAIDKKNQDKHIEISICSFILKVAQSIVLNSEDQFFAIEQVINNRFDKNVTIIQKAYSQIFIMKKICHSQNNTEINNIPIKLTSIIKNIKETQTIEEMIMINDKMLIEEKKYFDIFHFKPIGFIGQIEIFRIAQEKTNKFKINLHQMKQNKNKNWKEFGLKEFKNIHESIFEEFYYQLFQFLVLIASIIQTFIKRKLTCGQQCAIIKEFELIITISKILQKILESFKIENTSNNIITELIFSINNYLNNWNEPNKVINNIINTINYFQIYDKQKIFQTAQEWYKNKESILQEFAPIESFLKITEDQINRAIIEEQLSSSNRQNFMLAIDRFLGNSGDEQLMELFDKQRELLTHFGKLTRKSAPYFIQWIVNILQTYGTLKRLALTQFKLLNIMYKRIIYIQALGQSKLSDYKEIENCIYDYLRIMRYMTLSTRSSSLTQDSVSNTSFFMNEYFKDVIKIESTNLSGRLRWMIELFAYWNQLQFSPSPCYATYSLHNYLVYQKQLKIIDKGNIIFLLMAYASVMDITEQEHFDLIKLSSETNKLNEKIDETIRDIEYTTYDWIDFYHSIINFEKGNGLINTKINKLLGECIVRGYYEQGNTFMDVINIIQKLYYLSERNLKLFNQISEEINTKYIIQMVLNIADERVLICRKGVLLIQQEDDNFDDFCNSCSSYIGFNDSPSNFITRDIIKSFTQSIQNHDIHSMIDYTHILLQCVIGPIYHLMISYYQLRAVLGKILLLSFRDQHTKTFWLVLQRSERYFERFIGWIQLIGVLQNINYDTTFNQPIQLIRSQISKRKLRADDFKPLNNKFVEVLHPIFLKIVFALDDLLNYQTKNELIHGMKQFLPLISESNQFVNYLSKNNLGNISNPLIPFHSCFALIQSSPEILDKNTLFGVKKYLKNLSESLSTIFRLFDVQTTLINYLVDKTIKSLNEENIIKSKKYFNNLHRYFRLFPRMYLLVNSFYSIFDDIVSTHIHLSDLYDLLCEIPIGDINSLTPSKYIGKNRERSFSDPLQPSINKKIIKSITSNDPELSPFSFQKTIQLLIRFKNSFNALCQSHLRFGGYFVQLILNVITLIKTIPNTQIQIDELLELLGNAYSLCLPIVWITQSAKLCLVKYYGFSGVQLKGIPNQVRDFIYNLLKDIIDPVNKEKIKTLKNTSLIVLRQLLLGLSFNINIVGYLYHKIISIKNSVSGDAHISLHPTAVSLILETVGNEISRAVYDILSENQKRKTELPVRYVRELQKVLLSIGINQIHRRITDVSSSLMIDAVPLKAIQNNVSILISILIQTSPTEEMLNIIQKYYRYAFKDIKGNQLVNEKRGEKVRNLVQLIYSQVSQNPIVMNDIGNEMIGILSLTICICFSWRGYNDIIESNMAIQLSLAKIQFLLEVLSDVDFIKNSKKEVIDVLKQINDTMNSLNKHPFINKDLIIITKELILVICPLLSSITKNHIELSNNADDLLSILQEIASNSDLNYSFILSSLFTTKLVLHSALFLSEFLSEQNTIIKLVEERLSESLILSIALINFLQTFPIIDNHTRRSQRVMNIINKIIENSVMLYKLKKLRVKRNINDFPSSFNPINLPKFKTNFKVSNSIQKIVNAIQKGNVHEIFSVIHTFIQSNNYITMSYEELNLLENDPIKIDKSIRKIETITLLNRIICWILMISHNFTTPDDIPLISLEIESFMDSTENIIHSK